MSRNHDHRAHQESQYYPGRPHRRGSRYAHPQDPRDYLPSDTPRTPAYDLPNSDPLAHQSSWQSRNYQLHPYEGRRDETDEAYGQELPTDHQDIDYDPRPRRTYPAAHPIHAPPSTHSNPQPNWNDIPAQPAHPPNAHSQNVLDPREYLNLALDLGHWLRQTGYFVPPSNYYRPGMVFSILWHENYGSRHGTLVSAGPEYLGKYGQPIYSTIRRMVVIKRFDHCSWCFAISTYGGRGVSKPGVDKSKHAIVHLRNKPPLIMHGESPMVKEPLEVAPDRPEETLDPKSRLNFGKIYTVEHNVKVLPIGRITSASMTRFLQYASDELAL
ncbi:hypothetical protein BJX70DRAFT_73352 [Aspergillus crustosus]